MTILELYSNMQDLNKDFMPTLDETREALHFFDEPMSKPMTDLRFIFDSMLDEIGCLRNMAETDSLRLSSQASLINRLEVRIEHLEKVIGPPFYKKA